MSNALQLTQPDQTAIDRLDAVFSVYMGALTEQASEGARAVHTAMAVVQVGDVLRSPEILKVLRALAGSTVGFLCDREDYSDKILVDAATEAILRGLPLVSNRFNIIAERFYCTKAGFELLVGQLAKYAMGVQVSRIDARLRSAGGHVAVAVDGTYQAHNTDQPAKLKATYSVRVTKNNKVAEENAEGKGRRKWLRDVYAILTGVELPGGEIVTDESELPVPSESDELLEPGDLVAVSGEGTEVMATDDLLETAERWKLERTLKEAGGLDDAVQDYGPPDTWCKRDVDDLQLYVRKPLEVE